MDENLSPAASPDPPAGELTSSAYLEVSLWPIMDADEAGPSGVPRALHAAPSLPDHPEEEPTPGQANPADDLTSSAYLRITTLGPITVEARGTVPAGETHLLLMTVTSAAGILGAVVTAYIATHAPARDFYALLGLAAAELVLAFAVTIRIARRSHRSRNR